MEVDPNECMNGGMTGRMVGYVSSRVRRIHGVGAFLWPSGGFGGLSHQRILDVWSGPRGMRFLGPPADLRGHASVGASCSERVRGGQTRDKAPQKALCGAFRLR